jgi:hypothetical protein
MHGVGRMDLLTEQVPQSRVRQCSSSAIVRGGYYPHPVLNPQLEHV